MLQTAIEQTTTTVGTGTYDLTPPTNALRTSFLTGAGNGAQVFYRCESDAAWEEGWGVVTAGAPDTLTRNVHRSSNANAAINWPAGVKRIYCSPDGQALRFGGIGAVPSAGGTANAQAIAHNPPLLVLRPGMTGAHTVTTTNAGAVTLAVDGLGAQPLRRANGTEFGVGELIAGQTIRWVWNGTEFRVLSDVNRRDLGRELLASTSMVGGTGVEVTIPAGFQILEMAIHGARISTGTVQQVGMQVRVGGVWRTGPTGHYYDSRLYNTQQAGQIIQALADAGAAHFVGWVGEGLSQLDVVTQITSAAGDAVAGFAVAFTRMAGNSGAASWGWADGVCSCLVSLPANQRIEALRIVNISGSPRNFTGGRISIMGVRA